MHLVTAHAMLRVPIPGMLEGIAHLVPSPRCRREVDFVCSLSIKTLEVEYGRLDSCYSLAAPRVTIASREGRRSPELIRFAWAYSS